MAFAGLWRLFLLGAAAVLAPLAFGVWRANTAYGQYGLVAAETWSRPWFMLSSLALITFLLLLIYRRWQARKAVTLHQDGLAICKPLGRTERLTWPELSGITVKQEQENFLNLSWRTRFSTALILQTGKVLRIDPDVQNQPDLAEKIKARLYPLLMPEMEENFRAGHDLDFGPLGICQQELQLQSARRRSRAGFQNKGDRSGNSRGRILWSHIKHIHVRAGFLVVELETGKLKKIPVSRIPNFEILLYFIDQVS